MKKNKTNTTTLACLSLLVGFLLGVIAMQAGISSFVLSNATPSSASSVFSTFTSITPVNCVLYPMHPECSIIISSASSYSITDCLQNPLHPDCANMSSSDSSIASVNCAQNPLHPNCLGQSSSATSVASLYCIQYPTAPECVGLSSSAIATSVAGGSSAAGATVAQEGEKQGNSSSLAGETTIPSGDTAYPNTVLQAGDAPRSLFNRITTYFGFSPSSSTQDTSNILPASILPTQDLSNPILPSRPPVEVTRGENLPRTEPVQQQWIGEMGEQRIEEVAVQSMDEEPEDRVEYLMHEVAPALDVADERDTPEKADPGSIEKAGFNIAAQVGWAVFVEPLMLLLAMLFGGGR